jgi:hypothetical protein
VEVILRTTIALLVVLIATPAAAGPWVPEVGTGYGKVGLRWLPGFAYFPGPEHAAEEGWIGPQWYGSYNELFVETYAEFGVAPGVAVTFGDQVLRTFFLVDPRTGDTGPHASTGEPGLGFRVSLIRSGRFASSAELAVRAPLSSSDPVQDVIGTSEGHPTIGDLQIATGVWEVQGTLSAGIGWDRGYLAWTAGVAGRGGGYDTLVVWTVEGGRPMGRQGRVQGRVRISGQHPLGDGSAPYHRSPSGIGNGTRYLAFTLELERRVATHLSVGGSLAGGLGPVARQTGGPVLTVYLAIHGE